MSSIIEVGKSSIRKANASMVESRIGKVNPATGRNWFEVPSAEYQSWENKKADRALADRQSIGNQDINQERRVLTELQPLANNEANRAYGMKLDNDNRAFGVQLATQFPYKKYETETTAARESMSDTLRTMPSFLNRNTAVKPQQYVSF
jgi:hypothetical protein